MARRKGDVNPTKRKKMEHGTDKVATTSAETTGTPLACLLLPHSTIQNLSSTHGQQTCGSLTTPELLDAVCASLPKDVVRDVRPVMHASPPLRYCLSRCPKETFMFIGMNTHTKTLYRMTPPLVLHDEVYDLGSNSVAPHYCMHVSARRLPKGIVTAPPPAAKRYSTSTQPGEPITPSPQDIPAEDFEAVKMHLAAFGSGLVAEITHTFVFQGELYSGKKQKVFPAVAKYSITCGHEPPRDARRKRNHEGSPASEKSLCWSLRLSIDALDPTLQDLLHPTLFSHCHVEPTRSFGVRFWPHGVVMDKVLVPLKLARDWDANVGCMSSDSDDDEDEESDGDSEEVEEDGDDAEQEEEELSEDSDAEDEEEEAEEEEAEEDESEQSEYLDDDDAGSEEFSSHDEREELKKKKKWVPGECPRSAYPDLFHQAQLESIHFTPFWDALKGMFRPFTECLNLKKIELPPAVKELQTFARACNIEVLNGFSHPSLVDFSGFDGLFRMRYFDDSDHEREYLEHKAPSPPPAQLVLGEMPRLRQLSCSFRCWESLTKLDISKCSTRMKKMYLLIAACPALETVIIGELPKLLCLGCDGTSVQDTGVLDQCPSLTNLDLGPAPRLLWISGDSFRQSESLVNFDLVELLRKPDDIDEIEKCRITWPEAVFFQHPKTPSSALVRTSAIEEAHSLRSHHCHLPSPFLSASGLAATVDWVQLMRITSLNTFNYLLFSCLHVQGQGTVDLHSLKSILLAILGVLMEKTTALQHRCDEMLSDGDDENEEEDEMEEEEEEEKEKIDSGDDVSTDADHSVPCDVDDDEEEEEASTDDEKDDIGDQRSGFEGKGKDRLLSDAVSVCMATAVLNAAVMNTAFSFPESARDDVVKCFKQAHDALAQVAALPESLAEFCYAAIGHGIKTTLDELKNRSEVGYDPTVLIASFADLFHLCHHRTRSADAPAVVNGARMAEYICLQSIKVHGSVSKVHGNSSKHYTEKQLADMMNTLLTTLPKGRTSPKGFERAVEKLHKESKKHCATIEELFDYGPYYGRASFSDVWVPLCCVADGLNSMEE